MEDKSENLLVKFDDDSADGDFRLNGFPFPVQRRMKMPCPQLQMNSYPGWEDPGMQLPQHIRMKGW